jgi:hypothetical protein
MTVERVDGFAPMVRSAAKLRVSNQEARDRGGSMGLILRDARKSALLRTRV